MVNDCPFSPYTKGWPAFFKLLRERLDCEIPEGKILVSETRHYSIDKIAEALGIGRGNVIGIEIDEDFRMDCKDLEDKIIEYGRGCSTIIAVIPTIGTTEEGAIDPLHMILDLRKHMEQQYGISFWIHGDAAYGGYVRALLKKPREVLEEDNRREKEWGMRANPYWTCQEIQNRMRTKIMQQGKPVPLVWPREGVYRNLLSLNELDSVTVDPHKLGYIPYPAGAVVFKHAQVRDLISYQPPYIYHKEEKNRISFIGGYILEGSKPGAAAAACWLAHRTISLDSAGYGAIIGETIKAAQELYALLQSSNQRRSENSRSEGKPLKYKIVPIMRPDLNMVCFIVNVEGNRDLEKMNELNDYIYHRFSVATEEKSMYAQDFFLTKTEFNPDIYRSEKCIKQLLRTAGISEEQYFKNRKSIVVLRCAIFSPWLSKYSCGQNLLEKFVWRLEQVIEDYLKQTSSPSIMVPAAQAPVLKEDK